MPGGQRPQGSPWPPDLDHGVDSYKNSTAAAKERDQVGHVLEAERLFESLGHERLSGGAKLVDLGAKEGVFETFGAAELDGGRGLLGEESGKGQAGG